MTKTALSAAAMLVACGSALAGSDHYGSDGVNQSAAPVAGAVSNMYNSFTASIDQVQGGVDQGIAGPRVTALIGQVRGVDSGITAAKQMNKINPAEAHKLHMRAAHISRVAERTAAAGHGTISATQYR
jgi:hypothetical protein